MTESANAQSIHRDDDNGEVTHERQESWFDCDSAYEMIATKDD